MGDLYELSATELIDVGRHITVLRYPGQFSGDRYREAIAALEALTARCGFTGTHALAVTLSGTTFYINPTTKRLTNNSQLIFNYHSESVNNLLIAEADRKTVYLSEVVPPPAINEIESRLGRPLEPNQAAMRLDTVKCLRVHLSRPAIVTMWALGFDIVRWWVFSDAQRLAAFNQQYSKNVRPSEPAQIVKYTDMLHIGEYRFLSICRDAQEPALVCFTDSEFRELQGLLDQRNEFAHANFSNASDNEAAAYVERVVRAVTRRPFGQ